MKHACKKEKENDIITKKNSGSSVCMGQAHDERDTEMHAAGHHMDHGLMTDRTVVHSCGAIWREQMRHRSKETGTCVLMPRQQFDV